MHQLGTYIVFLGLFLATIGGVGLASLERRS
jgi:hypothetical protein